MIPVLDLLADHQEFHSDLQMNSFITLRSGGTLYGCYKQSLRELYTRHISLIQRRANRKRLVLEIESLEAADSVDAFQQRRAVIDLEEKRLMLVECDRVLKDTEREFERFRKQAESIRAELESHGIEFPLSDESRHILDCEMWEHNLLSRCAVEIYTSLNHQINPTTMEFIQCMPLAIRQRISIALSSENRDKLSEWFMSLESPAESLAGHIECSGLSDSPKLSQDTSPTAA